MVEDVDPEDADAFARWADVLTASQEQLRPGEPAESPTELREFARELLRPGGDRAGGLLAAVVDGRTVGAARLSLPVRDNTSVARLVLHVRPDARRRGVGTALLAGAVSRARAAGRTVLTAELDEPGPAGPGRAFAERAGAVCSLVETRRDLALPLDAGHVDRLEQAARPFAAGYELLCWRDGTPDALAADRAALWGRMSTDVPLGDLPLEPEVWDVPRLRRHEAGLRGQGLRSVTAAAAREGSLVGFSDLEFSPDAPRLAQQGNTLVLREHRGHRLGLLLKLTLLAELTRASPGTRSIWTKNARDNAPMIAVNEALGCTEAGTVSNWSLPLLSTG